MMQVSQQQQRSYEWSRAQIKCCIFTFIPTDFTRSTSMAIFKGDPLGSPNMEGMTVISDRNKIPWGSHNFLASAQQLYGDMHMMTHICMHKSHME